MHVAVTGKKHIISFLISLIQLALYTLTVEIKSWYTLADRYEIKFELSVRLNGRVTIAQPQKSDRNVHFPPVTAIHAGRYIHIHVHTFKHTHVQRRPKLLLLF